MKPVKSTLPHTPSPVSCMCLTYGRVHLLEEAIESFLRQDYRGQKELIILNDLPDQELKFEHPEVHIINLGKRLRTMGEKRNACAALCSYDWLFVWDDDDIYLPWRISYSMAMMDCERRFFKPSQAFVLNGGMLTGPENNVFHSGACWHRSLFDEVGGYPHVLGTGDDVAIESRFAQVSSNLSLSIDTIALDKIYYIYRWAGTGSYHISAFSQYREKAKSDHAMVEDYVSQQLSSGFIPKGEIFLNPYWKIDYVASAVQRLNQITAS